MNRIIREQDSKLNELETWKVSEEERKIKLAFYAGELSRLLNQTAN